MALLAATAAAFALTEGAKLEPSPISHTYVTPVFSPGITTSEIRFRLRKRDHLSVWMTRGGKRVATVVAGRTFKAGVVDLVFSGISQTGVTLPQGPYVPVVHFGRSHRTITIPSTTRIDTKPPVIHFPKRRHAVISPDGDGRKDSYSVHYTVNEPAHGILLVDGKTFEVTRSQKLSGELVWRGRIGGRLASVGNHVLSISARDEAGNTTKPFPFAIVQIRYIALGRARIPVRPGKRFAVGMSHDSSRVTWVLHGRHGTARGKTLHLRAPVTPGVYQLYVTVGRHSAKAAIVVG